MSYLAFRGGEKLGVFLLFSLVVGAALGALAAITAPFAGPVDRRLLWSTTLAGALIAAVGQHAWYYRRDVQPPPAESKEMQLARMVVPELQPPDSFWNFMSRAAKRGRPLFGWRAYGGWTWITWGLDATAVVAGAFAAVKYLTGKKAD
jgi:hypothetical protein